MRIVVTGSAGHLGEGLVRSLRADGEDVLGIDVLASEFTDAVGSVTDREFVERTVAGAGAVIHAATLHKPHVGSHTKQDFVDVNVTGTLNLLEASAAAGVGSFVFTSSTTTFGRALSPPPGAPAAWITESIPSAVKNVYGATKAAAEDLCQLVHEGTGLPVLVLRASRFFPEADDVAARRNTFADANLKVNELLHRRVDLQDIVDAHRLAVARAPEVGFDRLIVSATTPFARDDVEQLRRDPAAVVRSYVPQYEAVYAERGWQMFDDIERVYVNTQAREVLGWTPAYDFPAVVERLAAGEEWCSPLARTVGAKGYHEETTGIYTKR